MTQRTNEIVRIGDVVRIDNFPQVDKKALSKSVLKFIDTAGTATNRATSYNTKEEQVAAVNAVHRDLYTADRGIYAASLLMNGQTDYNMALGIQNLLSNKADAETSMIPLDVEMQIIARILADMPVTRVLKMFMRLKENRVNNARTRRVILLYILNSKSLEYWSVTYRSKLRDALEHAWNKRTTSILKSILKKSRWTNKEKDIVNDNVVKHLHDSDGERVAYVYECVNFILGNEKKYSLPYLKSFHEAKKDITKGDKLSRFVLEGIRGTYHKDSVSSGEVLKITEKQMTQKDKMKVQAQAERSGVNVGFDVTKQDPVEMYVYAFEKGMTQDMEKALSTKAKNAARSSTIRYGNVCVIVDGSKSMAGDESQKLRPMAIALATRDMLVHCADTADVVYANGWQDGMLVRPKGETNLGEKLIEALEGDYDAIFMITDGYENAPSGRVNEILTAVRNIGIETPVFQFSPVMSAEAGGVKTIGKDITVTPVSKPGALGIGALRALIEADVKEGIMSMFKITLPRALGQLEV